MDAPSTPPPREPDDQTGLAWRDDAWLAAWPLTRATALDYLACSPFYDRNCNNERAKAQGLGPDDLALMPAGLEYVLVDSQEPHLFVLRRQLRGAPGTPPEPQAVYYILDGTVYQAPAIGAVLSARLDRCLWSMQAAFKRMQADLDPLGTDAATAALPPPAPPTRRYTDAERARIQQADRVISSVLQGIVAPAVGGDGASLGAGEGGFAEPAPSAATGAS